MPMSGYEIKKQIESSVGMFWDESFGQLYPELRKLEDDGLTTVEPSPPDRSPNRGKPMITYAITPKGREVFQEWLSITPTIEPKRSELLLKVFFGSDLSSETIQSHVQHALTSSDENINMYRDIKTYLNTEYSDNPNLPFWIMTLDYGIAEKEAHATWARNVLSHLQTREELGDFT
jgi:DNA-binding PadR family transcriptional regulator